MKFFKDTCSLMVAILVVVFRSKIGLEPMNSVLYYCAYVFVIEASARLVTGLKVEYLSNASVEYATGAENVALIKPGIEYQLVGLRDTEGFAVHFFKELEANGKPLCNRMLRHYVPNDLCLILSPVQITRRADYGHKWLGFMRGMDWEEAHTLS